MTINILQVFQESTSETKPVTKGTNHYLTLYIFIYLEILIKMSCFQIRQFEIRETSKEERGEYVFIFI